jgi:release factor glutamine methyltransferase
LTTVEELLRWGASTLPRTQGIPDPAREARWLLARALAVEETTLWIHPEREVDVEATAVFEDWIERRAGGEPAHHLTGRCTFWGREFEVGPDVLVPRPETELVIEVALQLPVAVGARVLDVGTGSGCIAVTLAAERPAWRVVAVDRSPPALSVASRNAARHRARVDLLCGDLADSLFGAFDLVVANLPYVPTEALGAVPPEVAEDPDMALDGGADGLRLVGRLLADLPRLLKPCGGAVLEIGDGQADPVVRLAEPGGLAVARRIRDVGGCDRVVVLQRR